MNMSFLESCVIALAPSIATLSIVQDCGGGGEDGAGQQTTCATGMSACFR